MEIGEAEPNDYGAIRQILAENGWGKRVADSERFRKMMESASRTVVAVKDKSFVGFARALCDDVSNGHIGTVAVAEDMRGQ